MPGLGTVVNTAAVVAGGLTGLAAKGLIRERFQRILNVALALSIIAMSVSGFVSKMLVIQGDTIETAGTYMIIFSLALGGCVGEMIDIDGKMDRFGVYLRARTGNTGDASFVDGFVTGSLTICIGAMAVIGSIMDGIYHQYSILFTKSILDFIIIMIMTSSMGKGCIFSAIPVAVFQGSITALSLLIEPLLNDKAMNNLSCVGSILILCIGVNLLADNKFRIKVANLLPAIVFSVIAAYIPFL